MQKKIWFITHDLHIDHRISTFIKWSEDLNIHCRLFSAKEGIEKKHAKDFLKLPVQALVPDIMQENSRNKLELLDKIFYYDVLKDSVIFKEEKADYFLLIKLKNLFAGFQQPSTLSFSEKILNSEINWNIFRNTIYDFGYILNYILKFYEENSHETPSLLYVADLPTLPIGIILKHYFNVPLIFDAHEWWEGQQRIWWPNNVEIINLIREYEHKLYPMCDIRLGVGQLFSTLLEQECGCSFHPIYTTSDSLTNDIDNEQLETNFLHKRFGLPLGAKIVIFQGSLTTHRNLENMIKSVKYFGKLQYLIILGDGDQKLKEKFEEIAKDYGIRDKIIFGGMIPQKDLLSYTKHADLALLPYIALNRYYGTSMPNKLSEYIHSRVPIVFDESMGEIARVIHRCGYGISVDCSNPENLGTCLRDLLNDQQRLDSFKKNYELNSCQEFNAEFQKKSWVRLVNSLLVKQSESSEIDVEDKVSLDIF